MDNNNNSFKNVLLNSIGDDFASIKTAYEKHLNKRVDTIKAAEEVRKIQMAEFCYKYVCIEMSEVFRAAANVIGSIDANLQPVDIRLPFDGAKFIDGKTPFYFRVYKAWTGENTHDYDISVIQATVNKICIDRHTQGLTPFANPLETILKNEYNLYSVSVMDFENEIQNTMPLSCKPGQYLGLLRYDIQNQSYYISSRKIQPLRMGAKFLVMDGGIFTEAIVKQGNFIYVPSRDSYYFGKGIIFRGARIGTREI